MYSVACGRVIITSYSFTQLVLKRVGGGENIVKPNSDRTAIVTDSMFALKLL